MPTSRSILHLAAGTAALSAVACGWFMFKEGAFALWFVVAYLVAWLAFSIRVS